MAKPDHTQSYYAASANALPDHPELTEAIDCDVCIVGAGLTGCSAALELATRGYRAVVLESARVGWGASGRSGGQVISGYAIETPGLRKLVGREDTGALWEMSMEALALLKHRVSHHNIDCDFRAGHLHVAPKQRHVKELHEWQTELEGEFGYEGLRYLEKPELGEFVASDIYHGGLFDPHGGHVHPLNYTLGLAAAANDAGAVFYESSAAVSMNQSSARPVVATEKGQVTCDSVILCGNAYLNRLEPRLRSKIMPVGTYVIATEPLGEEHARSLMPAGAAVADINFVLDYYRLSADHRMLFGGGVSYTTFEPSDLAKAMRPRMDKVFSQLKDVQIEFAWGGFVGITMNRAPHFGRLSSNVYFAHGFSGHGIALTGLAGKLMAEAVAGTAERFDVFARIPHRDFPGGRMLRMPALASAMLYYRLRDLL